MTARAWFTVEPDSGFARLVAMATFSIFDWLALGWFLSNVALYSFLVDWGPTRVYTLTARMGIERRRWLEEMARRETRIMDVNIGSGLQNGTAFFASSSLLAIGAAFTLLTTDLDFDALIVSMGLPHSDAPWEPKALMLMGVYGYAFFKFGWAHRLFNYCSILLGAVPPFDAQDRAERRLALEKAIRMNIIAGAQFTRGLRAIFMSVPLLLWFAGPLFLAASITLVSAVLLHRQFNSPPLKCLQLALGERQQAAGEPDEQTEFSTKT